MGFKASFIVIQNAENLHDEERILSALGCGHLAYESDTTFDVCMNPSDDGLYMGYFGGNLIVCHESLPLRYFFTKNQQTIVEKQLAEAFPDREILAAVCHSVVNLHAYSLQKNGLKIREKQIAHEMPVEEYGTWIEEEKAIYEGSEMDEAGNRIWNNYQGTTHSYTEDQLMEEFTFGIAKRLLGVMISHSEDEQLMFYTPFRKYTRAAKKLQIQAEKETSLASTLAETPSPKPILETGKKAAMPSEETDYSESEVVETDYDLVPTFWNETLTHNPAKAFWAIGLAAVAVFLIGYGIDSLFTPNFISQQSAAEQSLRLFSGMFTMLAPQFLFTGLVYWLLYLFNRPTNPKLNQYHFGLAVFSSVGLILVACLVEFLNYPGKFVFSNGKYSWIMSAFSIVALLAVVVFLVNITAAILKKRIDF